MFATELEILQELWPALVELYNNQDAELTESDLLKWVLLTVSGLFTTIPAILALISCYELGTGNNSGSEEKGEDITNKPTHYRLYNQIAVPKQDYYRNISRYIKNADHVSCSSWP